ncbi:uncharacterized protein ASCRUDRAFT_98692 [Ascoidea rubescens DSM 1968]|uniref:LYC1 C-terminal domain-containing protein n=1 Tax=Ascoidea rubescens DSM 1968 TaxID=1344418 RepID=A0A1D2VQ70_9ASCO|nr:hypothetical protein ASCRUDRAFT_98692 [Ascoidea rubescens DSM 1968]ODV63770.1 hypothetical protein ASCRUDRAFT_98692 [Ascoidea rubescens DSM 1968]
MTVDQSERYKLIETTDPKIISLCHSENSKSWRFKLSTDAYVQREYLLGRQKVCNPNDSDDKDDLLGLKYYYFKDCSQDLIIGGCESLARYYYKIDATTKKPTRFISPCIGGVYIFPHYRAKGLGKIMLIQLNQILLQKYGQDSFSTLYSEVGDYYDNFGYTSKPINLSKLPPIEPPSVYDESNSIDSNGFSIVPISRFDLKPLTDIDNEALQQKLLSNFNSDQVTRVSCVPDPNVYIWHFARAIFTLPVLGHEKPSQFGIKLLNPNNNSQIVGFIIWTYNVHGDENELFVIKSFVDETNLSIGDQIKVFKSLINLSQYHAYQKKMDLILLWQSEIPTAINKLILNWFQNDLDGEIDQKNSSISAIKFHNKLQNDSPFIWEQNLKFCWF